LNSPPSFIQLIMNEQSLHLDKLLLAGLAQRLRLALNMHMLASRAYAG
jgi:hypothetical protein